MESPHVVCYLAGRVTRLTLYLRVCRCGRAKGGGIRSLLRLLRSLPMPLAIYHTSTGPRGTGIAVRRTLAGSSVESDCRKLGIIGAGR